MCCVGNDDDLRSVILGEQGAFAGMSPGAILVDHTTASADVARELANMAAESGLGFLDAPVSGGQAGAVNGVLTVMVGGEAETYAVAEPVIQSYARMMRLMGPAGSGQLSKMVNQICIAGLVQGLAEALNFAQCAGLDGQAVVDVISKGAAQSWQMENRYKTMLAGEFDFGFAVDWMRKDLSILLEESRRNGAQLPVTALVDQFYADVQAMGAAAPAQARGRGERGVHALRHALAGQGARLGDRGHDAHGCRWRCHAGAGGGAAAPAGER
ncbi:UNVERIFIED_CONTAM: putative oxidoreductase [Trichonephila clavipes]